MRSRTKLARQTSGKTGGTLFGRGIMTMKLDIGFFDSGLTAPGCIVVVETLQLPDPPRALYYSDLSSQQVPKRFRTLC